MPRPEEKPPNKKKVDEKVTDITDKMWTNFDVNEGSDIRNEKIVSFLIREIAELKVKLEEFEAS